MRGNAPAVKPLHHYSTTEQVVGTWIDEKTVFEKTLQYTMTSATDKNSYALIGADIDTVISFEGIAKESDEGLIVFNAGNAFYGNTRAYINTTVSNEYGENNDEWGVTSTAGTNMSFPLTIIVTIQYTKTTD